MKLSTVAVLLFSSIALAGPLEIRQTESDCPEATNGYCCDSQSESQLLFQRAGGCAASAAAADCKADKLYFCCGTVDGDGDGNGCARRRAPTPPTPCPAGSNGFCCNPQGEQQFLADTADTCAKSKSSANCKATKKGYCCTKVDKKKMGTGCLQHVF